MKLKYAKSNLQYARMNRRINNTTEAERLLWYLYLRKHECNFARQYRIGGYIVDFYCPKKKLVIELDGGQHYEDQELRYDENRTKYLNELGIKVLRYNNIELKSSFREVCEDIERNLKGE